MYFFFLGVDFMDEKIQLLANVVESSDDAIISKSLDGCITFWNKGADLIYGYSAEEVIGKNISILAPPQLKDEVKELIEKIKDGEKVFHYETVRIRKDTKQINVSITLSPILDNSKNLFGISTIARDITLRKNYEKNLETDVKKRTAELERLNLKIQEAREYVDNIIDTLIEPFLVLDNKMIIISSNNAFYETFEVRSEDTVGKELYQLGDGQWEIPALRELLEDILPQENRFQGYEVVHEFPQIGRKTMLLNARQVYREDLGTNLILLGIEDITERKKIEEALKLNQIRLANTMDLAHLANWELDLSTNMVIFNDRFYSMLGTTAENEGSYQMSAEDYARKYVHPEDTQFVAEGIKESLNATESVFGTEVEHRIIRKDGKIRYINVHIRVIQPNKNQSAYVYGSVQDITNRKITEEKLKESIKEKEMLLKEIHHRVKNNLMIISSLLNLQSRYIKDEASKDIFKESQNRARSMALIHERLYQATDLKRIDFGDYIRTLSNELFRIYAGGFGLIELKINVEDIFLDINTAIPLGLIVNELITNSLTHAFPEGKRGKINVNFHPKDDHYEFTVKDNGIGFPKDIDFQNTDSLGLQIINSLTDQIDGKIKLDRTTGTEFKILFKDSEL